MNTTLDRMKLSSTNLVPPDGWRVRMPEDDHLITHQTYHHLLLEVKAYRAKKDYPIGSNFEADLQNWMCQDLPDDLCTPVEAFNPETATLAQKAVRFAREIGRWFSAGLPVVSDEIVQERLTTCRACPYFNERGNLGMGECHAPGCGCSKIKLWLATSKCFYPKGSKWKR